jgi:TRAP-type C4-dicarboxylate transport system substrate-binding protein
MANSAWIKTLPEDLQKAVQDTAVEITEAANKFAAEGDAKAVDAMKKAGVTVIDPSPEFHQQLVDASKSIIPKFEGKVAGSKEIIEKIQANFKK